MLSSMPLKKAIIIIFWHKYLQMHHLVHLLSEPGDSQSPFDLRCILYKSDIFNNYKLKTPTIFGALRTTVVSFPPVLMKPLPKILSYLKMPFLEYCLLSRNSWNVLKPWKSSAIFCFWRSQHNWLQLFFNWKYIQ